MPDCEYVTVQLVFTLAVDPIVMFALPLPEPEHDPDPLIATANPEFAVAATLKLLASIADDGAARVTVMLWLAGVAVTDSFMHGAAE